MSEVIDMIKEEQKFTNSILVGLAFKREDTSDFVDPKVMSLRKFTKLLPILQGYSTLLNDCEAEVKKAGILGFSKLEKIHTKLEHYKSENLDALKQMQYCNDCLCSKCVIECGFDSCSKCYDESWVSICDKKTLNGVTFDNRIDSVTFDDETFDYYVHHIMQVLKQTEDLSEIENKRYIFMQNKYDANDKQVYAYIPKSDGADYNTIDGEEFDTVLADYQRYF